MKASTDCAILLTMSLVALLSSSSCERQEEPAAPTDPPGNAAWFQEVGRSAGLTMKHESGQDDRYILPAGMCGGVCLLDFDDDGFLDVYMVQAGIIDALPASRSGNRLYRNRGDATFEDVTRHAGVGHQGYGIGCTSGDFDSDGDPDLYVTNQGANVLYRNVGDGTFNDVTSQAGVGEPVLGASCVFADYDGDGATDLFITNYVAWSLAGELQCWSSPGKQDYCSPNEYKAPARDTLYRNDGDGTFSDVSTEAGLDRAFGNGLGVAVADFNMDGWLDFYIANDQVPNQLWINDGQGRFLDEALMSGSAVNQLGVAEAGMGVAVLDASADGDPDLFMSHIREESNTFYENAKGTFADVTTRVGLAKPSLGFTGFGLGFADFDHDGHQDLLVVNGKVNRTGQTHDSEDPYAEPNLLFRGKGNNRFEEILPRGGTSEPLIAASRAAAFGDLDNDGDIDVIVINKDAPPYLLLNQAADDRHWIQLRVLNNHGQDAIGALVTIKSGGQQQTRFVQIAYSYLASNDPRIHFGLGDAKKVHSVSVRWLGGSVEQFGPQPSNQVLILRQGAGKLDLRR